MISLPTGNFSLTFTTLVPVWEFPVDRFIQYEPSDEAWARPLGFGREVMQRVPVTIPNVRIKNIQRDGTVECEALPE